MGNPCSSHNMTPYPIYKDSGIPWLGQIPAHWDRAKLKRTTQFFYGESLSKENRIEGNVPVYGSNGVVDYHNKAITQRPCIIIGRKGSFGKVNYSTENCFPIDTTFYVDTTTTKNDLRWLYYLLLVLRLDSISKDSAVPGLNREEAYYRDILLPPILEQLTIAAFLDHKTRQIDTYIAKKQQQIERWHAYRSALINQAVTKGLNPDAPMKASGIEWLGEIPAHWGVKKTKYLFSLSTEKAPKNNTYELLSLYTDIGVKPRKDLEQRGNKATTTDDYFIVKKGDIVVNKLLAWMGAIGVSEYEGVTSPAYDILRAIKPLNSKFYHYLFRGGLYLTEFKRHSRGIMDMRLRLYFDEFGQILLIYPNPDEQDKIVNYLDQQTAKIDALVAVTQQQIDRLRAYRTSLISDAVTGKIDVRNDKDDT